MKLNSFQSLLIVLLVILGTGATYAISGTSTSTHPTSSNSLFNNPVLINMKDTLDPNNRSFHDKRSQAIAIRKVREEHRLERRKTKKDNFDLVAAVAILVIVTTAILGYIFFKNLE